MNQDEFNQAVIGILRTHNRAINYIESDDEGRGTETTRECEKQIDDLAEHLPLDGW